MRGVGRRVSACAVALAVAVGCGAKGGDAGKGTPAGSASASASAAPAATGASVKPEHSDEAKAFMLGRRWGFACLYRVSFDTASEAAGAHRAAQDIASMLDVPVPDLPVSAAAYDALRSPMTPDALSAKKGEKVAAVYRLGVAVSKLWYGAKVMGELDSAIADVGYLAKLSAAPDSVWKAELDAVKQTPRVPQVVKLAEALEAHYLREAPPPAAASSAASLTRVYPLEVPAGELLSQYKANEGRADEKFKGKLIETHGKVLDVKTDFVGGSHVTIGAGGKLASPGLQCFVSADQEAALAKLSKGQPITLRGVVDGLAKNVLVRGCVINPMMQVCRSFLAAIGGKKCQASESTGDASGLIIEDDGNGNTTSGGLLCATAKPSKPAEEVFAGLLATTTKQNPDLSILRSKSSLCYGVFAKVSRGKWGQLESATQQRVQAALDAL